MTRTRRGKRRRMPIINTKIKGSKTITNAITNKKSSSSSSSNISSSVSRGCKQISVSGDMALAEAAAAAEAGAEVAVGARAKKLLCTSALSP